MQKVLSIAGSDSCGGAGIQADIKTMSALGVYAMSVIVAVTAQNSQGVISYEEISNQLIKDQINAIFNDIEVSSVKIGMLSSSEVIKTVAKSIVEVKAKNIVIDPVMVSKSGYKLLKDEAIGELKKFISLADIITPNIPEAEILSDMKIQNEQDMITASRKIKAFGVKNVLLKGGHRNDNATDILLLEDDEMIKFYEAKIDTKHTHGTGCSLSSAIASFLAKDYDMRTSVKKAKAYITEAIKNSFPIGKGVGPIGHFASLYKKACFEN